MKSDRTIIVTALMQGFSFFPHEKGEMRVKNPVKATVWVRSKYGFACSISQNCAFDAGKSIHGIQERVQANRPATGEVPAKFF